MSKPSPQTPERSVPPSQSRLLDAESRRRKAHKILTILQDALGHEGQRLRCLDVGCAAGLVSYHMATQYGAVVGLDTDESALRLVPQHEKLRFIRGDAMCLPFKAGSFDVILCAQVYEHVPDPTRLMAEVWRVLADKGVCFFSGPNKLAIMEDHYGLPFLHWLPPRLASFVLRVSHRGHLYQEKPLTYMRLRQLVKRFSLQDYTVEMLRDPARYDCREEVPWAGLLRHIPRSVWRVFYPFLPNYNWLLRKQEQP